MEDTARHIPSLHELRKLAETTPSLYGCLASYDAGGLTIEQALGLAVVDLAKEVVFIRAAFHSYVDHHPPGKEST